ncbi:MAG: DUF4215 domain-containing protein [bacterium]|nr:DUF4215 domain-containing protein [bacterium]
MCTTCGDGMKDASEACDRSDPNDPNQDRCTSSCKLSYCGDGTLNIPQGEQCDTGSFCTDGTTNCTANPSICPGGPAACQPRYVNGCTPTCQLGCGNGIVDPDGIDDVLGNADDEECDDTNLNDRDACTNTCKRPVCGDDIITTFATRSEASGSTMTVIETCDDGNLEDGDNCPSNCHLSGAVINGICNFSLQSMVYYNDTGLVLDGPPQSERCSAGEPTSLGYDETNHQWTRTCQ